MDLKQIAKDTAKTLISYLTYQAMRTVLAQLSETDPPRALWLQQFSARQNLQEGKPTCGLCWQSVLTWPIAS